MDQVIGASPTGHHVLARATPRASDEGPPRQVVADPTLATHRVAESSNSSSSSRMDAALSSSCLSDFWIRSSLGSRTIPTKSAGVRLDITRYAIRLSIYFRLP